MDKIEYMKSYKFHAVPEWLKGMVCKTIITIGSNPIGAQSRTSLTGAFFSTNYMKRSTSEKAQYDLSSSYCV